MDAIPRPVRLALVLALGFAIRAWTLQGQSPTMDELSELAIAHRPLAGIVHAADGFPPLYHLVLAGWLALFGADAAARWLAVALGLGTIVGVERLATVAAGRAVGLRAALLVAVSPFAVWYAQEGRAYGLYLLASAFAIWALFRALGSNARRDWALYVGCAAIGLYTHYLFGLLVATGALLVALERRGLAAWRRPIAAHLAIAALALPLLALAENDIRYQAGYPIKGAFDLAALGYTYVSFLTGYTLGPSLRALHALSAGEAIVRFLPWLLPLGAAVAILAIGGARALPHPSRHRLAILLLLPVAAIGIFCELGDVGYNARYAIWAAHPLFVWLAAGSGGSRSARLATLVLLAGFAAALIGRHRSDAHRNEDVRALARWMAVQEAGDPVFVIADYMALPVIHEIDGRWTVHALHDIAGPNDLERALGRIETGAADGDYWLVYSRPFHGDPDGALLERLAERDHLRRVARFAGIELYRPASEGPGP